MAIAWLCFASLAAGQSAVRDTVKAADPAASAGQRFVAADYRIGASDILRIVIADMPEWSGIYPVSETGTLELPGMRVRAAGLTAAELGHTIALALQQAQQLRDPAVNVFVEEYRSQTVTVLGAVAHPSVYSLRKSTSLLEVLSMAGGLIPQSGNELTLQRRNWAAGSTETSGKDSISNIDLKRLMQGKDPALNLEIEGSDVVTVSTAPLVYVVGAVVKPGGFVLQDPGAGLTILQALAMAEGLRPTAAPNRALIIRTSPIQDALTTEVEGTLPSTPRGMEGRQRQEIQINMTRVLQGAESDVLLQANDVLFVPESGMKKSMQRMGEFAMQVVNGVAVYGIGYRVGGVR
ncbi:MAG: polysaccharide biosynthesis/export family protein [Candidatus Acidiferrales bacterium]